MSQQQPVPVGARVRTVTGPVRGTVCHGIQTFLAVPYAAPPFGPRRFRRPQPPTPWMDERDCTSHGPTAPAPAYRAVVRDLLAEPVIEGQDCLHVNVWSPDVTGSFPVFVWIHGGSFQNGSNAVPAYDGSSFVRDGVVAVGVNYRLGVEVSRTWQVRRTTVACSTRSLPSSGFGTTSPRSAGTRHA